MRVRPGLSVCTAGLFVLAAALPAVAGPPVPRVEVVNPDPIPVVGVVQVEPSAGGDTAVAVTELPVEVTDLLADIASRLDPVAGSGVVAQATCTDCGGIQSASEDLGDFLVGSVLVESSDGSSDFIATIQTPSGLPWSFSTNGIGAPNGVPFAFPIPLRATGLRVTCLDIGGCDGRISIQVVGRPLGGP
jgi:hypothetical protein